MIIVWILLGLVVLLAVVGVVMYNGLIGQRNKVEEGWRQIDVELKRRHDLIPNLVETVKGYASHERGTLEEVMQARSAAMSGASTPAATAQAEGQLSQALGRLMAVAEAYPDLKANQNFLALQSELSSTEDRIASSRRYYNALVRELNTKVESVPSNKRAEYFETPATEAVVPSISFGDNAPAGGSPAVSASTQPGAVGGPSTAPGAAPGALPQAQAPGGAQPDPTTDSSVPHPPSTQNDCLVPWRRGVAIHSLKPIIAWAGIAVRPPPTETRGDPRARAGCVRAGRPATSARVRQGPAVRGTRTRRSVPDLSTPGGASRRPRRGPRPVPA